MSRLEKVYGLYNIEDHEQCEFIGTKKQIAKYLNMKLSAIISYLHRRKIGKQKLIKNKFEIIEIEDL